MKRYGLYYFIKVRNYKCPVYQTRFQAPGSLFYSFFFLNILNTRDPLLIDEVKRITAHDCGKPTWHSFMSNIS